MRKLIEAMTSFDWITPAIGFLEDMINDPTMLQNNSWTFFVPYNESLGGGWNAFDIENLMRRNGIKTWGGQITGGEFFFSVKLEQAQWAEYILLRNRVPINETYSAVPNLKRKRLGPSRQNRKRATANSFWLPDDFFEGWFR